MFNLKPRHTPPAPAQHDDVRLMLQEIVRRVTRIETRLCAALTEQGLTREGRRPEKGTV